jgi:hypothetical protein
LKHADLLRKIMNFYEKDVVRGVIHSVYILPLSSVFLRL